MSEPLSRSLAARSRLPVQAGLLVQQTDALDRLRTAAALQRELATVVRDDVREALADGWSYRQAADALQMPTATLHRLMEAGTPVSVISARKPQEPRRRGRAH